MLGKEMLLVSKKSGPLTENNLIVQSSRGNGVTYVKDALGKEFTIRIGPNWGVGDQVFSVTFPVTIENDRKWEPFIKAINNALLGDSGSDPDGTEVTPIDPSKPAIIDVYNYY